MILMFFLLGLVSWPRVAKRIRSPQVRLCDLKPSAGSWSRRGRNSVEFTCCEGLTNSSFSGSCFGSLRMMECLHGLPPPLQACKAAQTELELERFTRFRCLQGSHISMGIACCKRAANS
ncbi:unnamed protein product [Effrenium voratum]|nr:unnamed protein product [Effrenium voratum]